MFRLLAKMLREKMALSPSAACLTTHKQTDVMKEECKGGKDYWLARDIQKSSSNCLFEASLGTVLLLQDHEYEGRKINSIFDFL